MSKEKKKLLGIKRCREFRTTNHGIEKYKKWIQLKKKLCVGDCCVCFDISHHRSKTDIYILGFPRKRVVWVLSALSFVISYLTSAVVTILGAFCLGGCLVFAHAALK